MSLLSDLLAAGSQSPGRIVMVPHPEWLAALNAAQVPTTPRERQTLQDLKQGAAATAGVDEVGIQANHLAAVLSWGAEPTAER